MSPDGVLALVVEHGYAIVFVALLLDHAGLPLPGELLLLLFGALARRGDVDLGLGIATAATAAMAGDSIGYWLGRLGGRRLLSTYCRVSLASGACVDRAVDFYRRRGPAAVVFGRFVVGVRAFLAPLAGSARMSYARFLAFDGVGALTWASVFVLAGYVLGVDAGALHERYWAGSVAVVGAGAAAYLLVKVDRRRRRGPASLAGGTAPPENGVVAGEAQVLTMRPEADQTRGETMTTSQQDETTITRPAVTGAGHC